MKNIKKIVITVLTVFALTTSCTGIDVGVGIPLGPVNIGVGTTIKTPRRRNRTKIEEKNFKEIKETDSD